MSEPFSVSEPFEVTIVSGGRRTVRCRYPTDQEWTQLANKLQIKRRRIGDETTIDAEDPDPINLDLVLKIASDAMADQADLADFDAYDGRAVLSRLQYAEPGDVTIFEGGLLYSIPLKVFGKRDVTIILRSPRQRQLDQYKKSGIEVRFSGKGSTARVNVQASATLFDALFDRAEGYADGSAIPIVHKDEAIGALIANLSPED